MTFSVSNTIFTDTFNTWRLNTNLAATVISNNAVTVGGHGREVDSGTAVGNAHVTGTLSATNLRATTLRAGNTTSKLSLLTISSNVSVNATAVQVYANTTFHGNVVFNTAGTDRLNFGDVDRWRLTGGTKGQFSRFIGTDQIEFKSLELRDITDLSSNSTNFILSSANTLFNGDKETPRIRFADGRGLTTDKIDLYLTANTSASDNHDLVIKLASSTTGSKLSIRAANDTEVLYIDGSGVLNATSIRQNGTAVATTTSQQGIEESLTALALLGI